MNICRTSIKFILFISKLQSIGDSVFIKSFEDTTLPFMDWTHEAHIRMAWNYISEYGKAEAVSHIKYDISTPLLVLSCAAGMF